MTGGGLMRAAAVVGALACVGAVKRLDLMATEGEAKGKYAFPGGEPEATCKACKAVMEHIERQLAKPYYDEYHHTYKEKQKRGVDARTLNKVDRISNVLDASKCLEDMKTYDLAWVGGQHVFQYKDPAGGGPNYPIHMELNDWAKNELGQFCESLMEEYEDELTSLLMEDEEENRLLGKPNATMRVCKEQLNLCVPPPPPPPEKKKKKTAKGQRKDRKAILSDARKVFADMDSDSNGWVDREEMENRLRLMEQSGKMKEGQTVESELDRFFDSVDKDKNGKVNFYEYKFLWVQPKQKGPIPGADSAAGDAGLEYYIGPTLAGVLLDLPVIGELAETAPGALLGGIGVTTAAVCMGGRAMRR